MFYLYMNLINDTVQTAGKPPSISLIGKINAQESSIPSQVKITELCLSFKTFKTKINVKFTDKHRNLMKLA